MLDLREKIDHCLEQLNWSNLWPGFHAYDYALYDATTVYLKDEILEKDNRFLGNTTIEFKGKHIAIWHVQKEEDIDLLTANIVHEMFHAHQNTLGENRYVSDIDCLGYPDDLKHYTLKHLELTKLALAQESKDLVEKKYLFNQYINLREKRSKLIPNHIAYEKGIESLEGSAEFVALQALKKLEIGKYYKQLEIACDWVRDANDKLFDTRRLAYYSGLLLHQVAFDIGRTVYCDIGQEDRFTYDLVNDYVSHTEDVELTNIDTIEKNYLCLLEKKSSMIDDILNHVNCIKHKGDFSLKGYDPMNMIRYKNYVLHQSFLMVHNGYDTTFNSGPIVIETDGSDFWTFKNYFTIDQERATND